LAGLDHDRGAFGQQRGQHDGVGVGALDLGQLGLEVHVALGERFGRGDRDLLVFQGLLEVVVAALGEDVVVAVEDGHVLQAGLGLDGGDGGRQHVGFGDRVAEHVVADGGDAVGGVGRAEGDRLGGLGDRIGGLGRVRQRGAEDHQDVVLEDQLLEDVDRFFFLALFVLDHEHDLVAVDTAGGVDFISGELETVADRHAVLGGAAGQGFRHAQLDVGCVGSREDTGGDQRGQQLLGLGLHGWYHLIVCLGILVIRAGVILPD
jgi:hypothetical protein